MYVSVQKYIPGPGSRLNNFLDLFEILPACLVMAASCRKCDCSMRGTARLPTPKCISNERLLRSKCIVDQNITRQREPGR